MSRGVAVPPRPPKAGSAGWRWQAACRNQDPDDFFPPDGRGAQVTAVQEARARAVCGDCPVRTQCLATALLRWERHGMWGGYTTGERDMRVRAQPDSVEEALAVAVRLLGTAVLP